MKAAQTIRYLSLALLCASQFATTANAATCSVTDVTVSLACVNVDGNDNETAVDGLFGFNYDELAQVFSPSGTDGILTISGDAYSGSWDVSEWTGVTVGLLAVKAGPDFAAYLLDLSAGTTGTWSTAGLTNPGGSQATLAHITLYAAGSCPEGSFGCFPENAITEQVPLPGVLHLFLVGLAGLGVIARRKLS